MDWLHPYLWLFKRGVGGLQPCLDGHRPPAFSPIHFSSKFDTFPMIKSAQIDKNYACFCDCFIM